MPCYSDSPLSINIESIVWKSFDHSLLHWNFLKNIRCNVRDHLWKSSTKRFQRSCVMTVTYLSSIPLLAKALGKNKKKLLPHDVISNKWLYPNRPHSIPTKKKKNKIQKLKTKVNTSTSTNNVLSSFGAYLPSIYLSIGGIFFFFFFQIIQNSIAKFLIKTLFWIFRWLQ